MKSFLKSMVAIASFSRWCATLLGLVLAGFLSVRAEGFSTRFEELKRSLPKSELYRLLYAMPKGATCTIMPGLLAHGGFVLSGHEPIHRGHQPFLHPNPGGELQRRHQ